MGMASTATSQRSLWTSGLDGAATIFKVHSALVLVQMTYAGAFILSKFALTTGVDPIAFVVYRDLIALAVLCPLAYMERGQRTALDSTILARFVFLGALGPYAGHLLLIYGIRLAPASFNSYFSISIPIYVFIISVTFGVEPTHWSRRDGKAKVGGLLSAVCGSILIPFYKGPDILDPGLTGAHAVLFLKTQDGNGTLASTLLYLKMEEWQLGAILLMLSAFAISSYIILQADTLRRYPAPISTATFAHCFGASMLAMTGFLIIEDRSEWVIQQGSVLFSLLYIGMISAGLNYALQAWALYKAGPVLVASYGPLQSFASVGMAYLFLSESIHLGSILGTLLTINGLFWITWGQVQSRKLSGNLVETLPNPDAVAVIKPAFNLEEPLLG